MSDCAGPSRTSYLVRRTRDLFGRGFEPDGRVVEGGAAGWRDWCCIDQEIYSDSAFEGVVRPNAFRDDDTGFRGIGNLSVETDLAFSIADPDFPAVCDAEFSSIPEDERGRLAGLRACGSWESLRTTY